MDSIKKVVLAYSGGLDTSVIIPWLRETYNCEVIAYCSNLGQGEELSGLEEKARQSGASKVYIEDLREEFVRDFIFPALRANAVYEDYYLLGTSLARPLIAKNQVKIAEKEGADAVSHGATGKGNDQVRFELTYMTLAPHLKIIAPWKDPRWDIVSRSDAIKYAEKHDIPIPVSKEKPYSMDANLMHISYEGGILEDPYEAYDPAMFRLSKAPENGSDTPETVEITFEKGSPVSINGQDYSPAELIEKLNIIGARHGIGIVDIVENRLVGIKSRGVYETPGFTILLHAHRALESLTLDRATAHYKQHVSLKYAELAYNGEWYAPLKQALDAFIDNTQKYVSGTIRLKLFKGGVHVSGRKSPYSMYSSELATFEKDEVYHQQDATGFIKLFGLQMKKAGEVRKKDE